MYNLLVISYPKKYLFDKSIFYSPLYFILNAIYKDSALFFTGFEENQSRRSILIKVYEFSDLQVECDGIYFQSKNTLVQTLQLLHILFVESHVHSQASIKAKG